MTAPTPEESLKTFQKIYKDNSCSKCNKLTSEAKKPWIATGPEDALINKNYSEVDLVCGDCE